MSMSKNYNNIIRATMFGNEILRDIQGKLNGLLHSLFTTKIYKLKDHNQITKEVVMVNRIMWEISEQI